MVAPTRVLVVDDSLIFRKIVRESLTGLPNVEVVGSASNGKQAIHQIESLKPDLVTLDFEMPECDGLGVLRWLRQQRSATRAVMLSAVTTEGAAATMQALQEGAFDFVVKPHGSDAKQNLTQLSDALRQRIETLRYIAARPSRTASVPAAARSATPSAASPRVTSRKPRGAVSIVGIGVSTGGPDALRVVLPKLPADLGVPVVLVQHMPPVFTKSLADSLDKLCRLRVREAEDGQPAKAGEVLIAPGGRQMKIVSSPSGPCVKLTDDPLVQSCRPSVDYLFASLAELYGAKTLAVIMTGMGYDGADGCRRIHQLGGPVIAQNEASCVVFGMPRKPVEEGIADVVAPLDQIADEIAKTVARR